jgi:hypothetical protein
MMIVMGAWMKAFLEQRLTKQASAAATLRFVLRALGLLAAATMLLKMSYAIILMMIVMAKQMRGSHLVRLLIRMVCV